MLKKLHVLFALTATVCIITFLLSTLLSELFLSYQAVELVKKLILLPGLFILVPSIAVTGASGFAISKDRQGNLVRNKKSRIPVIALNGLIILVPAAIYLSIKASAGGFDTAFYTVQFIEIAAGSLNLYLLMKNYADDRRLASSGGRYV